MSLNSLRSKLTASFVLAAIMLVTTGIISLFLLRTVNNVAFEIRAVWLPKVEHLAKIQGIIEPHRLLATRTVAAGDYQYLTALTQSAEATGAALHGQEEGAHHRAGTWQEKLLVQQFYEDWTVYAASFARIRDHLEVGEMSEATTLFQGYSLFAFRQAAARFAQLAALAETGSAEAIARAEEVYQFALVLTAMLIVVTAALVGWAVLWVGRRISAPLLAVSTAMGSLAQGDLSVGIATEGQPGDEIGTLFKAVGGYRDALANGAQLSQRWPSASANVCMLQSAICRWASRCSMKPSTSSSATRAIANSIVSPITWRSQALL
jgi:methyl-accepting chemotaxis protein